MNYVYVDLETTGLGSYSGKGNDEILSISIIDEDGSILMDTFVRPEHRKRWDKAEEIHHITIENVSNAPTYAELKSDLIRIFRNREVVIYNAAYDSKFLVDTLCFAKSVHCCMKAYAEFKGVPKGNDFMYQKLIDAYEDITGEAMENAHSSLADIRATRVVWQYLMKDKYYQKKYGSGSVSEVPVVSVFRKIKLASIWAIILFSIILIIHNPANLFLVVPLYILVIFFIVRHHIKNK